MRIIHAPRHGHNGPEVQNTKYEIQSTTEIFVFFVSPLWRLGAVWPRGISSRVSTAFCEFLRSCAHRRAAQQPFTFFRTIHSRSRRGCRIRRKTAQGFNVWSPVLYNIYIICVKVFFLALFGLWLWYILCHCKFSLKTFERSIVQQRLCRFVDALYECFRSS